MALASQFKHGDVVRAKHGGYVAIVTKERVFGDYLCLQAVKHGDGAWTTSSQAYTSGWMELHPAPDAVIADYIRAYLLGEVKDNG